MGDCGGCGAEEVNTAKYFTRTLELRYSVTVPVDAFVFGIPLEVLKGVGLTGGGHGAHYFVVFCKFCTKC